MVLDECAGFAKPGGCSSHWPQADEHPIVNTSVTT